MGGKAHNGRRINRAEAESLFAQIVPQLGAYDRIELCGSYRRGKTDMGDLDIVIVPTNVVRHTTAGPRNLFDSLEQLFNTPDISDTRANVRGLIDGVQVEFYLCNVDNWGSNVQMWTGSMLHNIRLRARAKKLGFSLSQNGARSLNNPLWVTQFATEESVYDFLGLDWVAPEDR